MERSGADRAEPSTCDPLPLDDIVETDDAFIGGAPKSLAEVNNPRGKGSGKPIVFVAASRDGQARARVVPGDQGPALEAVLKEWIDPQTTRLMSDGSTSYIGFGKTMASHRSVIQSQNEYANPETGAHANTAEAVISQMARALVGVYHDLGRKHLQRYLDEIIWRWNDRDPAGEIYMQWTTKFGNLTGNPTTIWKPVPVVMQTRSLLRGAVGKQMRRSKEYGLRWPNASASSCG